MCAKGHDTPQKLISLKLQSQITDSILTMQSKGQVKLPPLVSIFERFLTMEPALATTRARSTNSSNSAFLSFFPLALFNRRNAVEY